MTNQYNFLGMPTTFIPAVPKIFCSVNGALVCIFSLGYFLNTRLEVIQSKNKSHPVAAPRNLAPDSSQDDKLCYLPKFSFFFSLLASFAITLVEENYISIPIR